MFKNLRVFFVLLKFLIIFLLILIFYITFKRLEKVKNHGTTTTTTTSAGTTLAWSYPALFIRGVKSTETPETLSPLVCYTMSLKSFKVPVIPELEQEILRKTMRILVIVGDIHYGFLAATANVRVHSFGVEVNKMENLLRSGSKKKNNWDFNNMDAVSPFIDFMIIEQWTYNEHVISQLLERHSVKRLVILNTLLGQCPPFKEYFQNNFSGKRCTVKLNYAICENI